MGQFNLATDAWIKVLTVDFQTKTVSMIDFFKYIQNYQSLAGEMATQDVVILRYLLAVLTTIYSRVDSDGKPYDWISLDEKYQVTEVRDSSNISKDLLDTWEKINVKNQFTNTIEDYLLKNKDKFNFSNFYQVDTETFNNLVSRKIDLDKKKGTISVKQINRTISESGNTPATFSPKSNLYKNKIDMDELVRWLMLYENAAGVTDKNKATDGSISAGWYYQMRPIFLEGKNLFDTLMLNLVLDTYEDGYRIEKPIWEFNSIKQYVDYLNSDLDITKQSISFLYTLGARLLHIEWQKPDKPIIFTAGLRKFKNDNANDPMKAGYAMRDVDRELWVDLDSILTIGIIKWLKRTNNASLVTLRSVNLVSDGKPVSQMPIDQYDKNMLFSIPDNDLIKAGAKLSKQLSSVYWYFIKNISNMRGKSSKECQKIADRETVNFNRYLDKELSLWIENKESLSELISRLKIIFSDQGKEVVQQHDGPRYFKGIVDADGNVVNIFTLYNEYRTAGYSIFKRNE